MSPALRSSLTSLHSLRLTFRSSSQPDTRSVFSHSGFAAVGAAAAAVAVVVVVVAAAVAVAVAAEVCRRVARV